MPTFCICYATPSGRRCEMIAADSLDAARFEARKREDPEGVRRAAAMIAAVRPMTEIERALRDCERTKVKCAELQRDLRVQMAPIKSLLGFEL